MAKASKEEKGIGRRYRVGGFDAKLPSEEGSKLDPKTTWNEEEN